MSTTSSSSSSNDELRKKIRAKISEKRSQRTAKVQKKDADEIKDVPAELAELIGLLTRRKGTKPNSKYIHELFAKTSDILSSMDSDKLSEIKSNVSSILPNSAIFKQLLNQLFPVRDKKDAEIVDDVVSSTKKNRRKRNNKKNKTLPITDDVKDNYDVVNTKDVGDTKDEVSMVIDVQTKQERKKLGSMKD